MNIVKFAVYFFSKKATATFMFVMIHVALLNECLMQVLFVE